MGNKLSRRKRRELGLAPKPKRPRPIAEPPTPPRPREALEPRVGSATRAARTDAAAAAAKRSRGLFLLGAIIVPAAIFAYASHRASSSTGDVEGKLVPVNAPVDVAPGDAVNVIGAPASKPGASASAPPAAPDAPAR